MRAGVATGPSPRGAGRPRRDVRPIEWLGDGLRVLDQTSLPVEECWIDVRTVDELVAAIRRLAVRGAPLLGVAAGYGMALAAMASEAGTARGVCRDLRRSANQLVRSRPTAANMGWAVARAIGAAGSAGTADDARAAVVAEATTIAEEDEASCRAIGELGAELIPDGRNVLTHCNTGALATAGIGTALGIIRTAHERGKRLHVWVGETRPLFQGARLTAWELHRLRIPMTLISDGAAGSMMARGSVDVVVV